MAVEPHPAEVATEEASVNSRTPSFPLQFPDGRRRLTASLSGVGALAHGAVHGSAARWLMHLALILFLSGLALGSKVNVDPWLSADPSQPTTADHPPESISFASRPPEQGFLIRAAVPITVIPDRPRDEWLTYSVQEYDTVITIAEKFGLTAETLYWTNPELQDNVDHLAIDQELRIAPRDGVVHTVEDGDTLESVAQKYGVEVSDILDSPLNEELLALGGPLSPETEIFIPGGYKEIPVPEPAPVTTVRGRGASGASAPSAAIAATGRFGWPTDAWRITQWYWWGHRGIDIAGPVGTNIYAADSGWVELAGWSNVGYGYHVIVNHGNGFRSLYAHMSAFYVSPGQTVVKGQVIGAIGSTGRSTGPHLHFEIRQGGYLHNPYCWIARC